MAEAIGIDPDSTINCMSVTEAGELAVTSNLEEKGAPPSIEVTLDIDANGIVSVRAQDKGTMEGEFCET